MLALICLGLVLQEEGNAERRCFVRFALEPATGESARHEVLDRTGQRRPAQLDGTGRLWFLVAADELEASFEARPAADRAPAPDHVRVRQEQGRVRVERFGKHFTDYVHDDGAPYLYPVLDDRCRALTRSWPMETRDGETRDHPHHRSWWFAFGDVNGHDLWAGQGRSGSIRHRQVESARSGPVFGELVATADWLDPGEQVLCHQRTTLRVYATRPHVLADFTVQLTAGERGVVFGDTKEGMMAVRVASTMRLDGAVGQGRIANSEGHRDADTWGKRARWCDYSGPVGGVTAGIAILDHPSSFRHPTRWHVRPYGLFAANPFGLHDFEGAVRGTGRHALAAGEAISFRYRFVFHAGDVREAQIDLHADAFAGT